MNRFPCYFAATALATMLGATAAIADEDRGPVDGMSEQAISQIVTYAGYDVVDIDLDGDVYRGEASAPAGARGELPLQAPAGTMRPPLPTWRPARLDASRD